MQKSTLRTDHLKPAIVTKISPITLTAGICTIFETFFLRKLQFSNIPSEYGFYTWAQPFSFGSYYMPRGISA